MVSVGVCGDGRQTGAVVAVDGTVVSAVHVVEPLGSSCGQVAITRALRAARVDESDVDAMVRAGSVSLGASRRASANSSEVRASDVEHSVAEANQLRAGLEKDTIVVVLDDHRTAAGDAIAVRSQTAQSVTSGVVAASLMQALSRVAEAIGADPEEPVASLSRLADGDDDEAQPFGGAVLVRGAEICVDHQIIDGTIADAAAAVPGDLAGTSVHIEVARARRRLAQGILNQAADAIAATATHTGARQGLKGIGFAGRALTRGALAERLLKRVPDARLATLAGVPGVALGAALMPHAAPGALGTMALGHWYTDEEIKGVLDNCRLDYICEPDANRLYQRVSELLRTGALVGWFQGRTDFGGETPGNRSVLCDPSGRYARENVNVYLRGSHARDPLPVSLARSVADECALGDITPRGTRRSATIVERWRGQLKSVIDERDGIVVHVPAATGASELAALLEWHRRESAVPGLITVPLKTDGVLASDPRSAVRAMFGSAVDVLVIGRFLVSKDYWLIRSRSWRPGAAQESRPGATGSRA